MPHLRLVVRLTLCLCTACSLLCFPELGTSCPTQRSWPGGRRRTAGGHSANSLGAPRAGRLRREWRRCGSCCRGPTGRCWWAAQHRGHGG